MFFEAKHAYGARDGVQGGGEGGGTNVLWVKHAYGARDGGQGGRRGRDPTLHSMLA